MSNQLKDGGNSFAQISVNAPGFDDRLLRGNGVVRTPSDFSTFAERNWTRKGNWAFYSNFRLNNSGIRTSSGSFELLETALARAVDHRARRQDTRG